MYLHPVEALHGDLGMVVRGDVVLALSASGETEEILALRDHEAPHVPLITMTGDEIGERSKQQGPRLEFVPRKRGTSRRWDNRQKRTLRRSGLPGGRGGRRVGLFDHSGSVRAGAGADRFDHYDAGAWRCSGSYPERAAQVKEDDFANLHPGGKLGKRLARVESLMHSGEALPSVSPATKMPDVIYEMSRKKLGVTAVVEGEKLVGIVSDGDLRRLLKSAGKTGWI